MYFSYKSTFFSYIPIKFLQEFFTQLWYTNYTGPMVLKSRASYTKQCSWQNDSLLKIL